VRDRDVRSAIAAALVATSAFDPGAVWLWGLPETYGSGASLQAAAAIEPDASQQDDDFDDDPAGGLVITSRVRLTFLYRHEDPQLRDEGVELLINVAANALNGTKLGALTIPAWTKFLAWQWQTPTPPERRIVASFSYKYLIEGWDNFDTTL
jgi:hypothetical protein